MMAVSLPTGFLYNSDTSMENTNEGIRIYGSEDFLHSISKESMDQIRKTMLQHEELFKEQVQILHYLYNIQKSAMQEIRQAIYSQAQVLAFDSHTISDRSCKLHSFIVDGKPSRPAYVAPQNHVESNVLSQDASCAVKGLTSSSIKTSIWMNDIDAKILPSVQSKPRREIDLERPPEDYMDDIEIQAVANCYQALDANLCLTEEAQKKSMDDCPNLKQTNQITLMSAHPEPSQGIYQNCEQSTGSKILEALACNCTTGNQSLHKAIENNSKEINCNHLPAVRHPPVYEESKPSHLCLLQSKLTFAGQKLHSIKNSLESEDLPTHHEQVKGSHNSTIKVCQSLAINCLMTRSLSDLDEEEQQNSANGGSLSSKAVICPQSSSIHEKCDSKKLSSFCIEELPSLQTKSTLRRQTSCSSTKACQRSEDAGKENPNCSNHGSNSIEFLGVKVHKDRGDSTFTFKSDSFGVDRDEDPAQMSLFEAGVQSEHEEAAQLVNIGIKSFVPSSALDFKADIVDHNNNSNCVLQTCAQGESTTVTKSHEETRDESIQEEASESIAARILLSFVPDRSKSNNMGQDCATHMEVEQSRTNIDVACHERNRSLRARRTINYYDGGVMDETMKWRRSFQGRTLRRP